MEINCICFGDQVVGWANGSSVHWRQMNGSGYLEYTGLANSVDFLTFYEGTWITGGKDKKVVYLRLNWEANQVEEILSREHYKKVSAGVVNSDGLIYADKFGEVWSVPHSPDAKPAFATGHQSTITAIRLYETHLITIDKDFKIHVVLYPNMDCVDQILMGHTATILDAVMIQGAVYSLDSNGIVIRWGTDNYPAATGNMPQARRFFVLTDSRLMALTDTKVELLNPETLEAVASMELPESTQGKWTIFQDQLYHVSQDRIDIAQLTI